MANFNNITWSTRTVFDYSINNRNDYTTIKFDHLKGNNPSVVKVDIVKTDSPLNNLAFGRVRLTVPILQTNEATILEQKLFFGSNLLIFPNYIEQIENLYFTQFRKFLGTFRISLFIPQVQVLINPLTGQPVVIGQESLNLIRQIIDEAI